MKYFTMEELDYIAKELLENPNRETLKRLNDKYNSEVETDKNLNWVESQIDDNGMLANKTVKSPDLPEAGEETNNYINLVEDEKVNILSGIDNSSPSLEQPTIPTNGSLKENVNDWNLMTNLNTDIVNTGENGSSQDIIVEDLNTQSESNDNRFLNIELPKVEDTQNLERSSNELPNNNLNTQVPFNGNLWEPQNAGMNIMMQTTDNFNIPIEQNISSNQIEQAPLFNQNNNMVNNSIPVSENPIPEGPTMFGQFEQNFNNNAA